MSSETTPATATSFTPSREWQWGWAVVVLANLPVPFLFGCGVVAHGGVIGMFAGIAAVWLIGHAVITHAQAARPILVIGAAVFAPTQVVPVAQILAGVVALDVLDTNTGPNQPMSETTGFLVTLLTAAQLTGAALVCGLFIRLIGWYTEGALPAARVDSMK